MANYENIFKTNYFRVKDVEAFRTILNRLRTAADDVHDFSKITESGETLCCFGGGGILGYYDEELDELDQESWESDMMATVQPGDACILTEVGHEKYRYLTGYTAIITADDIQWLNLEENAVSKAREMLGDEAWSIET